MTTDELNAIVQAVMLELEKAGVDFDFKAETPQADDLVYVMRGTADKYQGITVKWQNLLDIIVKKATDAKNEAVSAKDIALQTLATIQGIESNVSSMKSSVETSEANVASMKASVEASESNVTQMKSDVSMMKASVEATKSDVEGMKTSVEATKTEVEGLLDTKADVTYVDGELAKKVNYTDSLSYEEIMATTDLSGKVASASALKTVFDTYKIKTVEISSSNPTPLELNNCTDLYTCYKWDYSGYKYVTCGGVAISSSAGAVINFPNLGGLTQVYVSYQSGSIKVRCLSFGSWSRWYSITTAESSL